MSTIKLRSSEELSEKFRSGVRQWMSIARWKVKPTTESRVKSHVTWKSLTARIAKQASSRTLIRQGRVRWRYHRGVLPKTEHQLVVKTKAWWSTKMHYVCKVWRVQGRLVRIRDGQLLLLTTSQTLTSTTQTYFRSRTSASRDLTSCQSQLSKLKLKTPQTHLQEAASQQG